MVQQARHRQIVAPRVIHRVCQTVDNQGGLLQHVQLRGCAATSCLFAERVKPYCPCCVQAAHSSNVSASVCLAQVDDARGDTRSALKYWARAAKLGHPEAQFRLGRVRLRFVTSSCWSASFRLHTHF